MANNLEACQSSILAASFSPDCKKLLTANWNGVLALWESGGGKQPVIILKGILSKEEEHEEEEYGFRIARLSEPISRCSLTSVRFSRDGKWFAVGAANGWVVIWNARGGEIYAWEAHEDEVVSLDFSPDRQYLATGAVGGNATFRLWRIPRYDTSPGHSTIRGEEVFSDDKHARGVWAICFSPDGRRVASGGSGLSTSIAPRVYWVDTGERAGAFFMDITRALEFSPDGKLFATGDDFGTVKIWNVEHGGKPIVEIEAHKTRVETVSFSPDGLRLASCSTDGTVRISGARTLEKIEECSFGNPILTCRFSPDGRNVYAAEISEYTDYPDIHVLPQG